MVISPWAKRGYVSHRHTTILSMHRTLYEIFGLPPLNMFDAWPTTSRLLHHDTRLSPYTVVPVDRARLRSGEGKRPQGSDYGQARKQRSIVMDDDDEMEKILQKAAKEASPRR